MIHHFLVKASEEKRCQILRSSELEAYTGKYIFVLENIN